MSGKVEKWVRWLEGIKQQTYAVMGQRNIYEETLDVVRANPDLPETSAFYTWLHTCYADATIMAIRRQVKINTRSISLARLLDDVRQNAHLLSRERWVKLFEGTVLAPSAGKQFDSLVGQGAAHLDPLSVEADLQQLREAATAVERWADKRIAHFDIGEPPAPPTWGDLDGALDTLDHLVKRYYLLVTADAIIATTPFIQHNWKNVFEYAWIRDRAI